VTTIIPEFKTGDRVYRRGDSFSVARCLGTIVHIEDNVAMVKYGRQDNRMIKLVELNKFEPPKPEPLKPGWYRIKYRPADNFIYYVQSVGSSGNSLVYTMAYNPKTGELDADFNQVSVLMPKVLLQSPRDLVRQKFVEDPSPAREDHQYPDLQR
jgi:hypothetical protein